MSHVGHKACTLGAWTLTSSEDILSRTCQLIGGNLSYNISMQCSSYDWRFNCLQALQISPVVVNTFLGQEFWLEAENGSDITAAYKQER